MEFKSAIPETGIQGRADLADQQRNPATEIAKNLLKHIPGEAAGFYTLGVSMFEDSAKGPLSLGILFALSLILLLIVRITAKASISILITSIAAFLIWMYVIDEGFLKLILEDWGIAAPWGAVVAAFFTAVVTVLASSGKIK